MRPVAGSTLLFAAAAALAGCDPGGDNRAGSGAVDLPRLRVDSQLREMGPDGWHRIALYANWDFTEPEVWRWIVSQPDCDRATALAIFWKAAPAYYVQFADRESVPAVNREGFDLISLIRGRWLAGAYTRSELAFDLQNDAGSVDLAELERLHGERLEQAIPASMRVDLPGRRIADDGPPLPGTFRL